MIGQGLTSRNGWSGLGTDRCEGGVVPSTPVQLVVVILASWISVLAIPWALGRTRPQADEMARKTAKA